MALAAATNCSVAVVFTPTSIGTIPGTLSVSSPSIVNAASVGLSGTGAVRRVGQQSSNLDRNQQRHGLHPCQFGLLSTAWVPAREQCLPERAGAGGKLHHRGRVCPGHGWRAGWEFDSDQQHPGQRRFRTAPRRGFDFSLALNGAGSQTVVAGTAASYKLVLTPLNGSSGTFAFACDALPTNALCLFNPPAQTLTGGVTGNVTVSVSTGSPTSRLRPNGFNFWAVIPLACGVLLLPMRRRRRQLLRMWVPLALLGVLLGVASCTSSGGGTGGGGGTSGGSGGAGQTPPGTYSIPLTVTSTGILHSVTVTLVVD